MNRTENIDRRAREYIFTKRETRERVNSSALRSNDLLDSERLKDSTRFELRGQNSKRKKTGANVVYSYRQENIFYVYIYKYIYVSIVFCPRDWIRITLHARTLRIFLNVYTSFMVYENSFQFP